MDFYEIHIILEIFQEINKNSILNGRRIINSFLGNKPNITECYQIWIDYTKDILNNINNIDNNLLDKKIRDIITIMEKKSNNSEVYSAFLICYDSKKEIERKTDQINFFILLNQQYHV